MVLMDTEKPVYRVPVEKLVISKTCSDPDSYEHPDRMVNVSIARKLGTDFTPGMRVSWIVTDGSATPQRAEPWIDGRPFKFEPDWRYYARRLASSLSRVTELWGWTEKALISGRKESVGEKREHPQKQATLF